MSLPARVLQLGLRVSVQKIIQAPSLQEGAGLIVMYALIVATLSLLSPYFLSANNFLNLLLASSTIGIIAMFTTMLMVGGGLDLSVGSTVALVGVIISHAQYGLGIWGATMLGIGIGILIGFLNGFIVTRLAINPLITTLGMLSAARGLAFVISGGLTEPVPDEAFGQLGRGFFGAVPVPVVVLALLIAASFIVMRYTTYGRAMYAIGGNPNASHLAGLPVKRYQLMAYTLSGLSAGIAGVFLTSRLAAGAPQAALGLELSVIGAVILGGTSLAGGKGGILGTVIGVLILGTLTNGMVLLSLSSYYQQIAQGLVLLVAVGLDQFRLGSIGRRAAAKMYRIGFANLSDERAFAGEVRSSLERAAVEAGNFSLLIADNKLDPAVTLSNADRFIREKVDLVIEYQLDEQTADQLMDKFRAARLPVIALGAPMSGAVYFGADNYTASRIAGEALGAWIKQHWNGKIDRLIALDDPGAGSVSTSGMQGQREGLESIIGGLNDECIIHLDSGNGKDMGKARVAETFARLPDYNRLAIISLNDEAALAALAAAAEVGRLSDVAVVGLGASRLAREEISKPDSRLIGSVMYAPERFGERLLQTARQMLDGDRVPPAIYVEPVFIDREKLNTYYP
jgi:ribose transport system permease protein